MLNKLKKKKQLKNKLKMEIPKNIAKLMAFGSVAVLIGTPFTIVPYFVNKQEELLNNSPEYLGVKGFEEELPKYEKELVRCVPRSEDVSALEKCVELANKYDAGVVKLTNLKNSPGYISTVEKADRLNSQALYSLYGSLLFFVPYIIGLAEWRRRRREEEQKSAEESKPKGE